MDHQDKWHTHSQVGGHHESRHAYVGLIISLALSFLVMYIIMYAMADRWEHVYFNVSNVYMTGLMVGSMVPIMLGTMPGMYKSQRFNIALLAGTAGVLTLSWICLRTEAGVGDRQFLRAMIPHHSAAIQMCKASAISDPRIKRLCADIVSSQEREISQMQLLLREKKSNQVTSTSP